MPTRMTGYQDVPAWTTADGSLIRELMHPTRHAVQHQSLAESTVMPGAQTRLHKHHRSEEIYHITQGQGRMTLGREIFDIGPGDTVCIPPGVPHRVANSGTVELRILCACAPAYSHADTELLDE